MSTATPATASSPLRILLSGATGWAGSTLARGIGRQPDLRLVGAVGPRHAGQRLDDLLDGPGLDCVVSPSTPVALAQAACDVYVEYAKPHDVQVVKANILAALEHGAHVVVASSGLSDADYAEIEHFARARQRGVLACGNFALTAVLLQRFAEMAARLIPHFEVLDFAKDSKPDAPSGTGRELALRLGRVRQPEIGVPLDEVNGPPGVRGATVNGVQVHALRLPGYVLGIEVVFGMKDQRLHIRHEAGGSAEPYVDGALLAIRRVHTLTGVARGLDAVMD
jgi:4-hydroxy-tetrahydrodipicolinate reductase